MSLSLTPAEGGPDAKDAFRHAVYKQDKSKSPKADAAEPAIAGEGWSAAGIGLLGMKSEQMLWHANADERWAPQKKQGS